MSCYDNNDNRLDFARMVSEETNSPNSLITLKYEDSDVLSVWHCSGIKYLDYNTMFVSLLNDHNDYLVLVQIIFQ